MSMYLHDHLLEMPLEDWFQNQYKDEYKRRFSYTRDSQRARWSPLYWRLDENLSVWGCLPDEKIPESWERKPTDASIMKKAREAWAKCDKDKARELRKVWAAPCNDPYYDRRYGCGSD